MAISKEIKDKITKLLLSIANKLDPSGENYKKYKELFDSQSLPEFEKWLKGYIENPASYFYIEINPSNEPQLKDILDFARKMEIPTEEFVYYQHGEDQGSPIRTKMAVPVGYVHIRRLQQLLSKKNRSSTSISSRNAKTGKLCPSY